MRIRILHASVNVQHYDVEKIAKMSYGEAQEFFEDDNIGACTWGVDIINPELFNAKQYKPSGIETGDVSDALFVWFKLVPWKDDERL